MKQSLLLTIIFFFLSIIGYSQSQLIYKIGYKFLDYPNWKGQPLAHDVNGGVATFSNHLGVGLEYSKQIKRTSLNSLVFSINGDKSFSNTTYSDIYNIGIHLGYRFYPFNQQDCDCPSFYQTGSIFSRGFNITPWLGGNGVKIKDEAIQAQFLGGIDLSLDLPFNKQLSLAPYMGVSLSSYIDHTKIQNNTSSNVNSLTFGVRLIQNLIKKRY